MPKADTVVEIPGAAGAEDPAAEAAVLRQQLADAQAQIEALKVASPKVLASAVVEPVTPHGAQRLAESEFRAMTTSDVHAAVMAGKITLGNRMGVLCADGYYCNPTTFG